MEFIKNLLLSKKKKRIKKWRELNPHNSTMPETVFDFSKVKVGNFSYGRLDIASWGNDGESLEIGSFVSIADNVKFVLGGNHFYKNFFSFPVSVFFFGEGREVYSNGPIIIEDDVWICKGAMILSGLKIGKGAIVGAGAVVSKDIEPYSIVVGNPVQHIKYRFNENTRKKLINLDFSKITKETIQTIKSFL